MPAFRPLVLSALLGAVLFSGLAQAQSLMFENAWSPEAPPVAPVMAGYVRIHNHSDQNITITGASCPDFNKVEIHDMQEQDGMMRMIKQDSLAIPAGQQVELAPGGLHMMLMKPKHPIKNGDTLPVTFELDNGETVEVSFEVRTRSMHNQHDGMQHHHHH
jgi:copper(I)-binding protein